MHIKSEIRVIGFDDGPFEFGRGKTALVVGVVCRAKEYVDGILSTKVKVDGLDSTDKIIKLVNKSRHYDQLRVILLNGIAFGGFNLVDIQKIHKKTKKIVIIVIRREPDIKNFKKTLKRFRDYKKRLKIVEAAGPLYSTKVKNKKIYFQCAGISVKDAEKVLKLASKRSAIPETIRLAHLIASGIVSGESKGRP